MKENDFRRRQNAVEPQLDELTESIIGACIEVHREFGPGLSEKHYEEAVCHEFDLRAIPYERQVAVPVIYKGKEIGGTRIDLVDGVKRIIIPNPS